MVPRPDDRQVGDDDESLARDSAGRILSTQYDFTSLQSSMAGGNKKMAPSPHKLKTCGGYVLSTSSPRAGQQ